MVVNSPGDNILTRSPVFVAMREDRLAYSSVRATTDEFLVSADVAVEMGHEANASFVNGVVRDQAAVSAAVTSPWSNGQAEGQITKLKPAKRQMCGHGKIDLLQAHVIGAP